MITAPEKQVDLTFCVLWKKMASMEGLADKEKAGMQQGPFI
jgi:hypothetical protein